MAGDPCLLTLDENDSSRSESAHDYVHILWIEIGGMMLAYIFSFLLSLLAQLGTFGIALTEPAARKQQQ